MNTENLTGSYERLANAVIILAVKDWRKAASKLSHGRRSMYAQDIKNECERFFKSDNFSLFTNIDGNLLLTKLKQETGYDC